MKKQLYALTALLITFPAITLAQSVQTILFNIPLFLNKVVLPFLFGVAFLFFVVNTIRFFVIEGSNEDGRKKAKDLAIYGVAAFVFLIIFYGLVNMVSSSIGLEGVDQPCPDYLKEYNGTCPSN